MSDFCFQSMQRSILGFFTENLGHFPFNKNSGLKFLIFHMPNGTVQCTFQLHRPNPSHCVFAYCSCKQDTKEQFWGQQFCEKERDNRNDETGQRGPSSKLVLNIPDRPNRNGDDVPTEIYGILGRMEGTLRFQYDLFNTSWTPP